MSNEKSGRTGKFCVAAGCTSTHKDNLSLHEFPKENVRPNIRRQWIKFVQVKRKDFIKPTANSVLCEKHFPPGSYPVEYELKKTMNLPVRKKCLLPDAVPTIHTMPCSTMSPSYGQEHFVYTSPVSFSTPAPASQLPPPKKMRTAFRKRECARVLLEQSTDQADVLSSGELMDTDGSQDKEIGEPLVKTFGQQFTEKKPLRRSVKTQARPKGLDKVIQAELKPISKSIGIQCNRYLEESQSPPQRRPQPNQMSIDSNSEQGEDESEDEQMHVQADSDYIPESEDEIVSDHSDDVSECSNSSPSRSRMFIVFEEQLLELLNSCPKCSSVAMVQLKQTVGSMVRFQQDCGICGYNRLWQSQPMTGAVPAGNLLMSAAILFSGSIPSKVLRFLDHMNVAAISSSTFQNHQKYYLHPSISTVWTAFQDRYLRLMKDKELPLILGGDGRADTPGHSAKYGSYAMLDLNLMMVVDFQLVQSNEVKSSYHMEKEGFVRSITYFKENGLEIGELVTDRHVQLVKYIREEMPDTSHHFDVWHVAKGLKKKLVNLAKEKQCEDLQPWVKSICNHLYWVAASTPSNNGVLMMEKWLSVANHVQNIHNHDGDLFSYCQNGELEGRELRKKWLKAGTKVCEKLQDLVSSRQMKKDIPKLSTGPQTAALEGFHAIINHFAPKMIGFSYHGMLSRITLACLHYNENTMRDQAVTKDGKKRYDVVFPKFKKGGYTVRGIKTRCTYGYVDKLIKATVTLATECRMNFDEVPQLQPAPPPLCSSFEKPNKAEAIKLKTSRYNSFQEDHSLKEN